VQQNTPTLFQRPDRLADPLYVVTTVFNSARSRTRWKLYEDFALHVEQAGAILYTVEVAFGGRDFVITQPDNPRHLQLRTWHELWLKEAATNLLVSRLPRDWKYVAWIDPDCLFTRPDWADETRHLLQHYSVAQMWSQLQDLNKDHEVIRTLRSFMDVEINGDTATTLPRASSFSYAKAMAQARTTKSVFGSPGLAWAARREAWDQMGGLIDYGIVGSGDWYFANAIMGTLDRVIGNRNDHTQPFLRKIHEYQENLGRAKWEERPLLGNVGVMKGTVSHYYHGSRSARQYGTRGTILTRNGFDPDRDLKRDWQGLYQLTDRVPQLRRDIQQYFANRQDDAS
jgi:hypothetical protein